MKSALAILLLVVVPALNTTPAIAAEEQAESPWETYSLSLGYFISNLDTGIRLGAGVGVDLDAEDLFDLDEAIKG